MAFHMLSAVELDVQQKLHPLNASLGMSDKTHLQLKSQMEHICLQNLFGSPITQQRIY